MIPDAFKFYPASTPDVDIVRRFERQFGYPPERIERDGQVGAWAGPICIADEKE